MFEQYLRVSEEVKEALQSNQPVVALESTIISHGMPYPKNVETALLVEKTVRPSSMTARSRPCPWRKEVMPSNEADAGKVSPTVFSTSSAAVVAAQ